MFDARFWMSYYHHMKTQAEKAERERTLEERSQIYYGNPETARGSSSDPQKSTLGFDDEDNKCNSYDYVEDFEGFDEDLDENPNDEPEERSRKKCNAAERFEQQYKLECLKERARNSSRGYRGYSSKG